MSKEKISKILKTIRQNAGLTQAQLATMVGKKQQTIASWEIGQSQPDADTLFLICDICDVSIDEVFRSYKKQKADDIRAAEVAQAYIEAEPRIQNAVCALLDLPMPNEDSERKNA